MLIAEDSAQEIRGASLEAQYYRAIIQQDWGAVHLEAKGRPLRSGAGCRDVSVVLGYDQVLRSASLLARQIRNRSMLSGASIDVWESSSDGSILHIEVAARRTFSKKVGDWEILWDEGLCEQLLGNEPARFHSKPEESFWASSISSSIRSISWTAVPRQETVFQLRRTSSAVAAACRKTSLRPSDEQPVWSFG